jgi:DNA-binding CsgD family transcriptional regulator
VRKHRRPGYDLSPREEQAIRLLAEGGTDKTIARVLGNHFHTVRDQIQSARVKLGAKTRSHLIALWIKRQI